MPNSAWLVSEVKAAEKELRDTKIKAPFNGKIALKNVEIGKLVTPGSKHLYPGGHTQDKNCCTCFRTGHCQNLNKITQQK